MSTSGAAIWSVVWLGETEREGVYVSIEGLSPLSPLHTPHHALSHPFTGADVQRSAGNVVNALITTLGPEVQMKVCSPGGAKLCCRVVAVCPLVPLACVCVSVCLCVCGFERRKLAPLCAHTCAWLLCTPRSVCVESCSTCCTTFSSRCGHLCSLQACMACKSSFCLRPRLCAFQSLCRSSR